MASPRTMATGSAAREDSTTSRSFVDLVATPGMVFSTSREAVITALFVTECKVSRARNRLEVRVTIDGDVADPGSAVLTQSTGVRHSLSPRIPERGARRQPYGIGPVAGLRRPRLRSEPDVHCVGSPIGLHLSCRLAA